MMGWAINVIFVQSFHRSCGFLSHVARAIISSIASSVSLGTEQDSEARPRWRTAVAVAAKVGEEGGKKGNSNRHLDISFDIGALLLPIGGGFKGLNTVGKRIFYSLWRRSFGVQESSNIAEDPEDHCPSSSVGRAQDS